MNIIKINVSFKKGFCTVDGIPLKVGDIESAKLVFDFDEFRGEKFFNMKNPSGDEVLTGKIINNELRLFSIDKKTLQKCSIFKVAGKYEFEVSLYEKGQKITSATSYLVVNENVVDIDNLEYFIDEGKCSLYTDDTFFVLSDTSNSYLICPSVLLEKKLIFNINLPKKLDNIYTIRPHVLKGLINGTEYNLRELGLIEITELTQNMIQVSIFLKTDVTLENVSNIVLTQCIIEFSSELYGLTQYAEIEITNDMNLEVGYQYGSLEGKIVSGGGFGLTIPKPGTFSINFSAEGYENLTLEIPVTVEDIISDEKIRKNLSDYFIPITESEVEIEEGVE